MRRIGPAVPALLVLTLAGCATGPSRAEVMQSYVGKPVGTLLAGMGVPNRSYDSGGLRYLAYDEERLDVLPGSFGGPWSGGFLG